ncbi:MAG TPA: cytochrome b/b6 domain-containing protein [Dissulfurispiraceae bacterium]
MDENKQAEQEEIRRFGKYRIAEHYLVMVTFAILAATGLAQKFHEFELSHWIVMSLGGIDVARLIHRYTGLTFALLTLQHIAVASTGMLYRRWPASIVINANDFTDAIDNIKYYFGVTNRPALCDRYDYKQKFEYWGVVIGGVLMIFTGVILWFPTLVARYLPGELIPAAKAAHTNEALLAFLVIIIWHIYNSIFSPEVFPLDTSIFTGGISRKRMVHEHPVELARMEGKSLEEIIAGHHGDEYEAAEDS